MKDVITIGWLKVNRSKKNGTKSFCFYKYRDFIEYKSIEEYFGFINGFLMAAYFFSFYTITTQQHGIRLPTKVSKPTLTIPLSIPRMILLLGVLTVIKAPKPINIPAIADKLIKRSNSGYITEIDFIFLLLHLFLWYLQIVGT